MPRKKANTVEEDWLLNAIACFKRSIMWSPGDTAREIHVFSLGYMKARDDLGLPEYGPNEDGLLEEFNDWLCRKLGQPSRVGWAYCIEQIDDSRNNVKLFISFFEEFLASKGRTLPPADVNRWVGEDVEPKGP